MNLFVRPNARKRTRQFHLLSSHSLFNDTRNIRIHVHMLFDYWNNLKILIIALKSTILSLKIHDIFRLYECIDATNARPLLQMIIDSNANQKLVKTKLNGNKNHNVLDIDTKAKQTR